MKVLCPNHKDNTPSLHLYEDRAFCFVCRYSCPIEEVANGHQLRSIKKEPTNVDEMLSYISQLPTKTIRGLQFPFDSTGYYIVYPDAKYYRKRLTDGNTRYIGPRGHRPPLFLYKGSSTDLVIVEGEINARTLWEAKVTRASIASPGSSTELMTHAGTYLTYGPIVTIVVDKDVPGVAWGLKLKAELIKRGRKVTLEAVEKDYNQVLQDSGWEAVKEAYRQGVGL